MIEFTQSELTQLSNALGDQYGEVRTFFYNVMTTTAYRYKLLVTRRAYVLYKIFEAIFHAEAKLNHTEEIHVEGVIVNSHSIDILRKLKNNNTEKVLIVDDIVINGRTIVNVYKRLMRNYINAPTQIGVWVYNCNCEAKCLEKDFAFKHVRYVTPKEWRIHSDRLTNFIIQTNVGYISYINSKCVTNARKADICASIKEKYAHMRPYDSENQDLRRNGIEATIFFFQLSQLTDADSVQAYQDTVLFCLRIYESEHRTLLVPNVFLPKLSIADCFGYCSGILKDIADISISEDAFPNKTTLYQFTINELGDWFIRTVCAETGIVCSDYFTTEESYIGMQNSERTADADTAFLQDFCFDEDFSVEKLKKEIDTYSDFSKMFDVYLNDMREIDEKRAQNNEPRYVGITCGKILDSLKAKNPDVDEYQILSQIIYSWDSGKTSYAIHANHDSIQGYVRHGEQAYKALYDACPEEYAYFHYFFRMTYCADQAEWGKFARYFDESRSDKKFSRFLSHIDFSDILDDLRCVPADTSVNVFDDVQNYVKSIYQV